MQQNLKSVTTVNPQTSTIIPYNSTFIASFILTIPFIFLLGVIGYRKHRSNVRRRRIAILEKMWMINVRGNTFRQD